MKNVSLRGFPTRKRGFLSSCLNAICNGFGGDGSSEDILRRLNVSCVRRIDGTVLAVGNIYLVNAGEKMTELPDLSDVELTGNFYCSDNALTSLKGAPYKVSGDFVCSDNMLHTLEGAPRDVGGHVLCGFNPLANLDGAPKTFLSLSSDFGTARSPAELEELFAAAQAAPHLAPSLSIDAPLVVKKLVLVAKKDPAP